MNMKRYDLDTIGQIYGPTITKTWSPTFRVQVTLHETVDPALLQQATDNLRSRFPYIFVALKKGLCSYYFEETNENLQVQPDGEHMLAYYGIEEAAHHCLRVIYGKKHIAIEILHVLTDGNGANVILFTLLHRYLELRHGLLEVPANSRHNLVYSFNDKPIDEESENAFTKNAGSSPINLKEPRPYKLQGMRLTDKQEIYTIGAIDTDALVAKAHSCKATVTTFLSAVMAEVISEIQNEQCQKKAVAIGVPVDLRKVLASKSMRNCVAQKNLVLLPEQLNYSLEQKCDLLGQQLNHFRQDKELVRNLIAAYVTPLENPLVKHIPCIVKDRVISYLYTRDADAVMSINLSNLGEVKVPEEMRPFIDRVYFILGQEKTIPNTCTVISFNGKTSINFTRNIQESAVEDRFFRHLKELGLNVDVEQLK